MADFDINQLVESAKGVIPALGNILDTTWNEIKPTKETLLRSFGDVLIQMDEVATSIYKRFEKEAVVRLTKDWFESNGKREDLKMLHEAEDWDKFINQARAIFIDFSKAIQELEFRFGQMRKSRGGNTFQRTVCKLINLLGLDAEIPTGKNAEMLKRVDIVVPNVEVALSKPDHAVFITSKRTLRERWKQEASQIKKQQRFYLITIDTSLPALKADEIDQKEMIAFIRPELKQRKDLLERNWIRSLNDFPEELLR